MGLPFGFHYLRNMALYTHKGLKHSYLEDYGEDLENHFDQIDKALYKERVFCLDCPDFEACRGKFWQGCPNRAEVLRIIRKVVRS